MAIEPQGDSGEVARGVRATTRKHGRLTNRNNVDTSDLLGRVDARVIRIGVRSGKREACWSTQLNGGMGPQSMFSSAAVNTALQLILLPRSPSSPMTGGTDA
jgi:hypothetical protein